MSDGGPDQWRELNRAWWYERAPLHVAGDLYDVPGFIAGAPALRPFELAEVGPVRGLDLVHLQCHFGQDTLDWARQGANVVGLDFSAAAVEAGRALAHEMGLPAEFVTADVSDAVEALGGRRFDIVYTGLGALNWLPDLERWAHVVTSLVRPGGIVYLVEFHPFQWVFADDDLTVAYSYFNDAPLELADEASYGARDATTVHHRTIEWNHPLAEILGSLLGAGLVLEHFAEHDHTLFQRWPCLEHRPGEGFHLPPGIPSLPLMFSSRWRKPAP